MFEVVYADRKNDLKQIPFEDLREAIDDAKDRLRGNLIYATNAPMVRVYEGPKMVAVIEGRVGHDGRIIAAREQNPDGSWNRWERL